MALGQGFDHAELERFIRDRVGVVRDQTLRGFFTFGTGAPSGPPGDAPRAIWLRLDGAVGSLIYAWDGTAWQLVF